MENLYELNNCICIEERCSTCILSRNCKLFNQHSYCGAFNFFINTHNLLGYTPNPSKEDTDLFQFSIDCVKFVTASYTFYDELIQDLNKSDEVH